MINQPLAEAFGSVLRDLRDARDLSQEALALEAGLDRTYISMLERGVKQPTLTTLFLLAKALRVSIAEMVRAAETGYMAIPSKRLRAAESALAQRKQR